MVQIYLLSVLLNSIGGYALTVSGNRAGQGFRAHLDIGFGNKDFRLILGILSLVIGLLKLLSPMRGDVRVIGDLLPALSGLLVGLCLLAESHNRPLSLDPAKREEMTRTSSNGEKADEVEPKGNWHFPFIDRILLVNEKAVGAAAMTVGVAHFFFPMELFL